MRCMKVKFMHNLLKLILIYHLKWVKNLLQVFIFFKKKSVWQICPTGPSDRITQVKNFNRSLVISFKSMSIFLTLVSKYAKKTNRCYYFSMCTLIFHVYTNFAKNFGLLNLKTLLLTNFKYIKIIQLPSRMFLIAVEVSKIYPTD